MFNIFRRKLQKKKAVFTTKIDLSYDYKKNNADAFEPGGSYYSRNEKRFTYEQVKSFVTSAIEKDFPREVEDIAGLPVYDIRVNRTYTGSIELVFTILFNSYQFVVGIKDFFDSLRLIRDTSDRFLKTKLRDQYGDIFDVNTSISYPQTDNYYYPDDLFMGKRGKHLFSHLISSSTNSNERDGFFYYLLFANIVLTGIIIYMVWKAVSQTYAW